MRDEFRDIVAGWALLSSAAEITDRIERATAWAFTNGPLQPDEAKTLARMIAAQVAREHGAQEQEPPRET